MSAGYLFAAFVVTASPLRARLSTGSPGLGAVAVGAVIALAAGAALVVAGEAVLAALEISPESFRLAAGLVLFLEGVYRLYRPREPVPASLPGLAAGLTPVAFPLLLGPGLVVLALLAGAESVPGPAVGVLAAALAPVVPAALAPSGTASDRMLAASVRIVAALEIALAADLAIDGIRAV